jgi:hypothetical protein
MQRALIESGTWKLVRNVSIQSSAFLPAIACSCALPGLTMPSHFALTCCFRHTWHGRWRGYPAFHVVSGVASSTPCAYSTGLELACILSIRPAPYGLAWPQRYSSCCRAQGLHSGLLSRGIHELELDCAHFQSQGPGQQGWVTVRYAMMRPAGCMLCLCSVPLALWPAFNVVDCKTWCLSFFNSVAVTAAYYVACSLMCHV